MIKFNDNNIVVGEIKQLLHSFNLPNFKVYREGGNIIPTIMYDTKNSHTFNKIVGETTVEDDWNAHARHVQYIKDNKIQEYIYNLSSAAERFEDKCYWKIVDGDNTYFENKKFIDRTKNLEIKNNIYDSYTHEYLGNYLRFVRDYYNLNLMPLYNCFSDRICNDLKVEGVFNVTKTGGTTQIIKYAFNSKDQAYKIYMLPVKLFEQYTIAIDSAMPVEVFCGVYGQYYDERQKFEDLPKFTYQKFNSLSFNKPVTYNKLTWEDNIKTWSTKLYDMELIQNEDDLKLFIKLPFNNNSSIVVLEGDYTSNINEKILNISNYSGNEYVSTASTKITNKAIINFEKEENLQKFKPISPLWLLKLNTGESYPFSNTLIEYLCGNTIDTRETLPDNIKRVQKIYKNIYNSVRVSEKEYKQLDLFPGIWSDRLRAAMYENIMQQENITSSELVDIFGDVNKTVEKYYGYDSKDDQTKTLMHVNLYEDLYKED